MKLLVDMGNSTLKWATISDGVLSQVLSLGYDNFIEQLNAQWKSLSVPVSVTVSCVTDEQHWQALTQLTKTLWNISPERVASSGKGYGVVNAYYRPENLGSDRWAVLVAAHALYQQDICIVDCGTALNIELLLANGQHLGGVIVPGADMMQSSLHLNTAAISQSIPQSRDEESEYWGQDTQSGIVKGSWQALAGAVKQVFHQFEKQAERPVCVLCGGGAEQLARYLDMKLEFQPGLVLKGLAVIAGENITR